MKPNRKPPPKGGIYTNHDYPMSRYNCLSDHRSRLTVKGQWTPLRKETLLILTQSAEKLIESIVPIFQRNLSLLFEMSCPQFKVLFKFKL
jgi:hypothetical protein